MTQKTAFKQVTNNASSIVTTSLAATGVTSISVTASTGSIFPQPGNGFWATLWNNLLYPGNPYADPNMEKVLCSARSGDTLTISATVNAHVAPCTIALLDVADNTTDLQTAVNNLETGANLPAATFTSSGAVKQTVYNVRDYGAVGNTKVVSDGAITSSTAILTSATASFTAADVGKQIAVMGAGTAAANLNTTILSLSNSTTVVLNANASTTVSGASVTYGTDDTTAVTSAITALNTAGGGVLLLPGNYNFMLSPQITLSANTHVINQGIITINPNYTVSGTAFLGLWQVGDNTGTNIIDNVEIEGGICVDDCFTPLYTTNSPTFNPNNHKYICYIHSVSTHRNCQFHDYKVYNMGSPGTLEKVGGVSGTPTRNTHFYNITEEGVWVGVQFYCNGYLYEHCSVHDITVQYCYDDCVAIVGSNGGTAGSGTAQKIQVYNIRGEKTGQTGAFIKLDATNGIFTDISVSNITCYTNGVNEEVIGIIGATSASNKKYNFWGIEAQGNWTYGLYGQSNGRHISLTNFQIEALFDIHFQGNTAPNNNMSIKIAHGALMSRNASLADHIEGHGIGFSASTSSQGFQNVKVYDVDTFDKGVPINEGLSSRTVTDGAMSSTVNPSQLSSATANFTSADVGYGITVAGAGAGGATLSSTITSLVSSTVVTLGSNCSTTVSGASVVVSRIPGGTGTQGTYANFSYDVDVRNSNTTDCLFSSTNRKVRFYQQGSYVSDSGETLVGPISTAIVAKSSAFTAAGTSSTILVSGATSITLPTAAGITGRQYTIKKTDSGTTSTIATTSSQTIDGATSIAMATQYEAVTVQSDGANWWVINQVATSIL